MNHELRKGVYEHFKGKRYELLDVGKDSESLEEVVIYKALYGDGQIWIRPLKMFLGKVELNGKKVPRFKFVGEK